MGEWRRGMAAVLGVVMCLNTACFSFVPVASGADPVPGRQVRVRLNAEGTDAMTKVLGPGVVYAEGTVVSQAPDSIVVGVTSIHLVEGVDRFWAGQNVTTFPTRLVSGVDVKTMDRGRTRIAAIGGGAAILGIFALALGVGGAKGQPGGGGSQPPP